MPDASEELKFRIAPEGLSTVAFGVGLSLIGWLAFWLFPEITSFPAIILSLITLGLLYFFRDPARIPVAGDDYILAPADGCVLPIGEYILPDGRKFRVVSIFLSIFNVHVNRSPVSGIVKEIEYRPGKFLIAYKSKAVEVNEMNRITIECAKGTVITQQVAGALARRVVCNLQLNQTVKSGDRIGIMKFGSRMDIIIPDNIEIKVKPGDKVTAGLSIIGVWIND